MPTPNRPTPVVPAFLLLAVVSGLVLAAAVVLWVTDVIPLAGLIGIVVVTGLVEVAVVVVLQRRASREQARSHGRPAGGGSSTVADTGEGYDPMDGLDGGRRR